MYDLHMCNKKYFLKIPTKQAMATCLLCFACLKFTMTLYRIILLPGQGYSYVQG